MTLTALSLLLAAIFASAFSACTPDQWEGIEGSSGGYALHGHTGIIKEYVHVHYDYKNRCTAAFLDYVVEDHENRLQIITRYNGDEGYLYIVDLKQGSCWMKKTKRPFRQACIPDDAKSLGDYYMGLQGKGGFEVSGYEIKVRDITVYATVKKLEDGSVVPIGEAVYGKLGRVGFYQAVGFINLTLGIKNATVFDVPEQCEERFAVSEAQLLTREHYVLAL